jgi:carboxypeptidase C (cathepsin A)
MEECTMKIRSIVLFFLFISYVFISLVSAQVTANKPKNDPIPPVDLAKLSKLSITAHNIKINQKVIRYKATTGYMLMKDENNQHHSSIFFIAYTLEGKLDPKKRPITFVFNGGPGSASLWLHMGALGPKRVKMSPEGLQLPQPFQYVDNEDSWLDFTDLVFIDPVSTGYSRPVQGVDKKRFHGVKEDVRSVGDFIRLYITKNERWLSPKYVCGESYGTTRAAGLSGYLQDTHGMYLKGLVLVSSILNFQTARFQPGNDLPYALFLPTYTAGAFFHKKLPAKYQQDLKETLKEVEQWAMTDYWLALAKGNSLSAAERSKVIDKLAQYTGLSKSYIDEQDLRIEIHNFTRQLLRSEKQTIGRLDNRFKAHSLNTSGESLQDDPSYIAIYGPYTAAINDYTRKELNYAIDLPYWSISEFVRPWNWGKKNTYVNVAETLRFAMSNNIYLKVLIANGYHDLATPYFATQYTVNHMGLPPDLAKNIIMKYYESGHMMYIRDKCRTKLRKDVHAFYTSGDK